MARRFSLDKLPDEALEALFNHLTYDNMARLSVVSRGWNRALSLHACHLWATPVFDPRRFGTPFSIQAVRGVLEKARDALMSVTFTEEGVSLLDGTSSGRLRVRSAANFVLGLHATYPALCEVSIPEADVRLVHELLAQGLTRLDIGRLSLDQAAVSSGDAVSVLTHPALRVRHLHLQEHYVVNQHGHVAEENDMETFPRDADVLLGFAASAMDAHATWLKAITVAWHGHPWGALRASDGKGATAFLAAVKACQCLGEVNVPAMLTATAFDSAMEALAAHGKCESAVVEHQDFLAYLPAVLGHLLPHLVRLNITTYNMYRSNEDRADNQNAVLYLASELHKASKLKHLILFRACDMYDVFFQLCGAVATTGITTFELHDVNPVQLGVLAGAGFPRSLTSLVVHGMKELLFNIGGPLNSSAGLGALLQAAENVKALSFGNFAWTTAEFFELTDHLTSLNTRTKRVQLTNVEDGREAGVWAPLCAALWISTTLEELTVSPVRDDACAKALANGIQRTRALKVFSAGVHFKADPWVVSRNDCILSEDGLGALVEAFRYNRTLRSMSVVANGVRDMDHLQAMQEALKDARDRRARNGRGRKSDEVHVVWGQS